MIPFKLLAELNKIGSMRVARGSSMAMGRLLSESESIFGLFVMMSRSTMMDTYLLDHLLLSCLSA
jgi:hypothetical protein